MTWSCSFSSLEPETGSVGSVAFFPEKEVVRVRFNHSWKTPLRSCSVPKALPVHTETP